MMLPRRFSLKALLGLVLGVSVYFALMRVVSGAVVMATILVCSALVIALTRRRWHVHAVAAAVFGILAGAASGAILMVAVNLPASFGFLPIAPAHRSHVSATATLSAPIGAYLGLCLGGCVSAVYLLGVVGLMVQGQLSLWLRRHSLGQRFRE